MRFSYATDIIVCHLPQNTTELMSLKADICTAMIIDEPTHLKVWSSHCHKSLLSDNHKLNKSKSINDFSGLTDESVLIIGGGPSGIDLVYSISEFAKTVIFSHHTHNSTYTFPNNVTRMGLVQKFTKNGVVFTDGTDVEIDVVIFCTGKLHSMGLTKKAHTKLIKLNKITAFSRQSNYTIILAMISSISLYSVRIYSIE